MSTAADSLPGHPRKAYSRYVLTALSTVYMFNLLDRGVMSLLLQPIKEDLRLSDTQLGFLTGIAFGLFYATLGVPIARWADRGNRVTIASIAIGLWGLTVMACLFVTNFLQLVVARMAAAVGESGCKPPTYSLVGDYFPGAAERTRAMSVYWLAGPVASLVSFIVGGWLNERYGWRITFFLMGIPGLLLAVAFKMTVVDPRSRTEGARVQPQALPSVTTVLRTLWHQRSCRHLTIALILTFTMFFGLNPWSSAFLVRSHGMSITELGVWLGLAYGLSGIAGVLAGGYVANRWFARSARSQMRMSCVAVAAATPCFVVFLTFPERSVVLLMLALWYLVLSGFVAPTYALMQRLVPDEMRATTMAVIMLLYNLIGMGIGPQLVGIVSDLLAPFAGNDSLRYALLLMSVVALWAAYHFWRAGRTVEQELSIGREDSAARHPANGFGERGHPREANAVGARSLV